MRPWVPIVIVGLVALLVLAVVIFYLRWRKTSGIEEEVRAYQNSDAPCYNANQLNGWICERWAHHPGKHWQTINGERYEWE